METPTTKKWYNSRTVWLGILTTAIGMLGVVQAQYNLAIFTTISGILTVILRNLTTTPIE